MNPRTRPRLTRDSRLRMIVALLLGGIAMSRNPADAQVVLTWTSGDLLNVNTGLGASISTPVINSDVTVNITTTGSHTFDGRLLVNNGTIVWSGGNFVAGNSASFTNNGTLNDTSTGTFGNSGVGGTTMTFTNAAGATYNKQSAGTKDTHVVVTNAGTINVDAGTLRFNAGGSSTGTLVAKSGATVQFTNHFSVPDLAQLTGSGLFELTGGTLTAGGSLAVATFNQTGGTLAGTFTLASGNTFNWSAGNWNASGTATIARGAVLTLSSSPSKEFNSRSLTNSGTLNWQGGHLASGNGGTFVNAPGGAFNDANTSGVSIHNPFGGSFTFTNDGTYRKTGAGTTTVSIPFTNTGTLAVDAGTLVFNGTFTNSGALTLAGGAALQSSGAIALGTSTLSGTGTVTAPSVTAGGLVSPGNSSGSLSLTGNLTLLATSTLLIELGGTTAGSGHDFLGVGGGAALAGTLSLRFLDGFEAFVTPTTTFTVLTASGAGGLTGAFANVANGAQLATSDGRGIFQVNYGAGSAFAANSVVLSNFVPVPEPSTYVLLGVGAIVVVIVGRRRRS